MRAGIENHIDWTVPSTTAGDRLRPSLARIPDTVAAPRPPLTKRAVLDKLLGENRLAAHDADGTDPYNATGRHFRR